MRRETIFSPDRQYRYTLWRKWNTAGFGLCTKDALGNKDQFVQFIGLNPSTADEREDDPTIRRCIGFAESWGFGALCMTNLFAFRSTDPAGLRRTIDPVGPENLQWVARIAEEAPLIICCWGLEGSFRRADRKTLAFLMVNGCARKLHYLEKTANGFPSHPLYLRKDCRPSPLCETEKIGQYEK